MNKKRILSKVVVGIIILLFIVFLLLPTKYENISNILTILVGLCNIIWFFLRRKALVEYTILVYSILILIVGIVTLFI